MESELLEYPEMSPISDDTSLSLQLSSNLSTNQAEAQANLSDTELPSAELTGFKIVGDNVDKHISPRFVRLDNQQSSVHYFNSYAFEGRIPLTSLSDIPPSPSSLEHHQKAIQLLPSSADNEALRTNFIILVSRIITTYIPTLRRAFSDVVDWHIDHPHSAETAKRSKVVSNFIYFKYMLSLYILYKK